MEVDHLVQEEAATYKCFCGPTSKKNQAKYCCLSAAFILTTTPPPPEKDLGKQAVSVYPK